jgi:hypothetical protein
MDKNIQRFVYQILVKILSIVRHNAKLCPLQSDIMLSTKLFLADIGQSAHLRTKQTVPVVSEPWERIFLKQFLTRWVQPMVKVIRIGWGKSQCQSARGMVEFSNKYMKTALEDGLGVVDNMEGNEQFGWAALLQWKDQEMK